MPYADREIRRAYHREYNAREEVKARYREQKKQAMRVKRALHPHKPQTKQIERTPEEQEAKRLFWRTHKKNHPLRDEQIEARRLYQRKYREKRKTLEGRLRRQIEVQARKNRIVGSFTLGDIEEIYALQREKCAICRRNLRHKFHIDHIIPVSRKGSNRRSNLQLLCASCNLSKWAKDPIDFMRSLGRLL